MTRALLVISLAACGGHHATTDAGDGTGLACVVDHDCTNAKCCSNVCVETADCSFAVTNVSPPDGFLNGGKLKAAPIE